MKNIFILNWISFVDFVVLIKYCCVVHYGQKLWKF